MTVTSNVTSGLQAEFALSLCHRHPHQHSITTVAVSVATTLTVTTVVMCHLHPTAVDLNPGQVTPTAAP